MRARWLAVVGAMVVGFSATPAYAAVVSVDAGGVMTVSAPEGGDLRVECADLGTPYCIVGFESQTGGTVVGTAPACLPDGLTGKTRCTGVTSRNVTMGSSADTLTLTTGYFEPFGSKFAGRIDMGGGNDVVNLGESYGSDVVVNGAGSDTVSYEKRYSMIAVTNGGGADDGTLAERDDISAEIVEAGRGNDVVTDLLGSATLLGGLGDDTLTGGTGANSLQGQSGADTLNDGGGADSLQGGTGNDTENGGDGDDFVLGDDGDDVLRGGAGADGVTGGNGADELRGEGGDDSLAPGPGSDPVVSGGDGTDRVRYDIGFSTTLGVRVDLPAGNALRGFATATTADDETDALDTLEDIWGGAGNDELTGTDGVNRIEGGTGSDMIKGGLGGDIFLVEPSCCGDGNDTISYDEPQRTQGIFIVLGWGIGGAIGEGDQLKGPAPGSSYAPPSNVIGTRYDDIIVGDNDVNVLWGGDGDDILDGGVGSRDDLHGQAGTDTASYLRSYRNCLTPQPTAGSCVDTPSVMTRSITASLVTGTGGETGSSFDGDDFTSIESLEGAEGNDVLTGDGGANSLRGNGGDDTLRPGTVSGAGDGDADTIDGGQGSDLASFDDRSAPVVADLAAGTVDGDAVAAVERATGGSGDDVLAGDAGANVLDGAAGNDTLEGLSGVDDLRGGAGAGDTLSFAAAAGGVNANLANATAEGDTVSGFENLLGSAHGDVLRGDGGPNRIEGGLGDDTTYGGAGNDDLRADDGRRDTLADCGDGEDTARGDRLDELVGCETAELGAPVELAIGDVVVDETDSSATVTVSASAVSGRDMSVRVSTADGTATAGKDYTATSVVATIPRTTTVDNTAATVTIPLSADTTDEIDLEHFTVSLSDPVEAVIADGTASVSIRDDDQVGVTVGPPIDGPSVDEGEVATFPVLLTAPAERTITIAVHAGDETDHATAGDYTPVSTTLTYEPGDSIMQMVEVSTTQDDLYEDHELVSLHASVVGVGEDTYDTVFIQNDDTAPSIALDPIADATEGAPAQVTARLSEVSGLDAYVVVNTADGTAGGADYTDISGTALRIDAGQQSATVELPTTADALDEADSETVAVSLADPVYATLGADATRTAAIADDDDLPTVSVSGVDSSEADGEAVVTVSLAPVSGRDVTVELASADGTAVAPADYAAISQTVTIPAGVTAVPVSVAIPDDAVHERAESFAVSLSGPVAANLGTATAPVSIADDDDPPAVSIADVSVDPEGTGETPRVASFVVSLTGATSLTTEVSFTTRAGTAGEADFTATSGTLTFPAGTTSQEILVAVTGDALDEDSEEFAVVLSDPVAATIADDSAAATILDDDAMPTVSIADATAIEGSKLGVVASLSAVSGRPVTVRLRTSDGSAVAPGDFTAVDRTLTIPAGATEATFEVETVDDTTGEAAETFRVSLSDPVNVALTRATATATITDNDKPGKRKGPPHK